MSETENSSSKSRFIWILFGFIIVAVYFYALDLPLLGPDEPRYAQVAREMYERGDWITTTLGGFNWFEKPALLYWVQITFYNIFGVSEISARIGSALFGLGTIGSLWYLGRFVPADANEADSKKGNSELGNWMALVAASSIGLIAFARGASFDITITFPITASLVSFFVWEVRSKNANARPFFKCLIAFYVFVGIALIAKGLIGIVFPFAIVSFYYVLRLKIPSKTLLISFIWGTVLSLLVASVWYLPMYLINGWEFIDEFIIQHHFQRFRTNNYSHPGPFWYFFAVLPAMTIPWTPFFLVASWNLAKEKFRRGDREKKDRDATSDLRTFAFAWILVPLVFFSLSGSKLPGYILPALPATCILTAEFVFRFVQKSKTREYTLQGLAVLTFTVVVILLRFVMPSFALGDSAKGMINTANEKGYRNVKILNMYGISHSAEYYGVGRLVRESSGKQKRFDHDTEIVEFLRKDGAKAALILIPTEFLSHLQKSKLLETRVLDNNAELTIVAVRQKPDNR